MTFKANLDPSTGYSMELRLYRNVTNVSELRQKLMKGELKCAVIKPSLIADPFQIVVAANKAVLAEKTTTKSLSTEVLFNLSISTNITQSLIKFGIDDKETDLLVLILKKGNEENNSFKEIDGEECDISELQKLADLKTIKKNYKISDEELKVSSLIDSIVTRISVKEFVSV